MKIHAKSCPHESSSLPSIVASTPWQWTSQEQNTFEDSKELFATPRVLAYYDPQLPLVLACDASSYGFSTVLAHCYPGGSEKPAAYVSHTLSVPEKNYSPIKKVLQELHDAHPGLTQMKRIAQTLVWCPGLDKDVEERVQCCLECKSNQCSPPLSPLQPWKWPTRPGSRLHTDFVGPFIKHMFLIIIEAHSKWLEVHPATSMNATVTIQHMHTTFSTFRLPEILLTDNGPSLCAEN